MVPDPKSAEIATSFASHEKLLAEGARWDELLQLYEGRLEREPDGEEAAGLMARAANLLLEKLEDPGRAERWLKRLLEREPNHVAGREGLQRIYEERGDHQALCELLEKEALEATEPEEAAGLYIELATILEERLDRRPRALVMLQRALRLVPEHAGALERARGCYLALGRLEAAKALIDRERASQPARGPVHAQAYVELGALALERPFLHELAAACAKAALEADPSSVGAKALQETIEALRSDWEAEVVALRKRAVEERDRKEASRLYLQAAALHAVFDPSGDSEARSRENLERAFLLWPGNPDALTFLEERHGASGDWSGLVKAYEALIKITPEQSGKAELHLRLSMVWSVRFDDRAACIASLQRAAALDPTKSDAVIPLVEHLEDEGRVEEAAELIERHLDAGASGRRASELAVRLAELQLAKGERERARGRLLQALELEPEHERAEELLEPLLEGAPHAAELARLLERRSERSRDPAEKLSLLLRATKLAPPSSRERLKLHGRALLLAPERQELWAELEELGRGAASVEAVAQLYESAIASVGEPELRRALLVRLALVLEEDLARPAEAAAALQRASSLAPDDRELAENLERLLGQAGEHAALLESYRKRLERTSDAGERRILLGKLVPLIEQGAKDPEGAVTIYRELLALEPSRTIERKLAAALGALLRWDEQREVLASLAEEPGPEGLAAKEELATLLAKKLDAAEEAAALHLSIVEEAPERAASIAALEELAQAGTATTKIAQVLGPLFAERGEWNRYALILGMQIASARGAEERRELLEELSRVHLEELRDPRGGFSALVRAFVERPSADELLDRLGALAAELGAEAELAKLLQSSWRTADVELDGALARRAAGLAKGRDPLLLEAALERLLELDPKDIGALQSLEEEAARAQRWPEATALAERLLAVDHSPDHRAERGLRLASHLREQGLHQEAARALEAALAAGAEPDQGLALLADSLKKAGLDAEYADVLTRQLERANAAGDGALASRLSLQRARILEGLGSKIAAVADYKAILAERPFDPDAIAGLEALLSDPEARADAARSLERTYVSAGEWRKLHGVLEIQIADSADPGFRARELRRLSQLSARELGSPALAFGALARAFEEAPEDPLLRSELRVAASEADCNEELAELMEGLLERRAGELPLPQLLAIERELAELYEKKLEDRPNAIARYGRMRQLDPSSLDALRGLHRLYRGEGDWAALYPICLELARSVFDLRERLALWREAGRIAGEHLDDPALAADCWRLIAEADPSDAEALVQLDGLYVSLERWKDLAWTVERRRSLAIRAGVGPGMIELGFRLAQLRRGALGDHQGALELFREVLANEPDHAEARAALDEWARRAEPGGSQALDLLDRTLRAAGQHERRLEIREARLALPLSAEERERRFEELRTICEVDLHSPELAFATCSRAFAEGVELGTAHLERLARKAGRFTALADLYEARLLHDPQRADGLRRRAAEIREIELGDRDAAIRLWRAVAAEAPDDPQAMEALERLFREEGHARELVETLSQRARNEGDPSVRREIHLEVARLLREQLQEPDQAIEEVQRCLEIQADDAEALELLGELLAETHRWDELAALYERRLAALQAGEEGADERSNLRLALAALLEGRLGDPSGALGLYAKILVDRPDHVETRQALLELAGGPESRLAAGAASLLAPLFEREGELRSLVDMLETMAGAADEPKERAELYAKIAGIYAAQLASPELAFFAAGRALRAEPDEPSHLGQVTTLAAEASLEEDLCGLLGECAVQARTLEGRLTLSTAHARLLEQSGEREAARAAWKKVSGLAPDDLEALRALARLDGELGAPRGRIEALRGLLAREEDPAACAALLLEIAEAQEELKEPAEALASLRRASEIVEPNQAVLEAMDRLCVATSNWRELEEILLRGIELEAEEGGRHRALVRLADLRESRLDDRAGALDALHRVLRTEPTHLPARETLEALLDADPSDERVAAIIEEACRASGDWQRVVELLEDRAERLGDPEARKRLWIELAKIRREHQGRADLAFLAVERAFREEPSDPSVWQLAAETARAAEVLDEWVAAAEREVPRIQDPGIASELAVHLGAICEEELQDDEAAIAWLERADHPQAAQAEEIIQRLERLYQRQGRWEALAGVLERLVGAEPSSAASTLMRLGAVYEERLGDPKRAAAAYERILVGAPSNLPALRALEVIYEKQGDREALLRNLSAQRGAHSDGGVVERLLQRTGDLAVQLGKVDVAASHFEELLELDPDNELAAHRLEALYGEADRWEELAALLRRRLESVKEPSESSRLHERLGGLLFDRLGDEDGALRSFQAVLGIEPRNRRALEALRRLHGNRGEAEELADVLRKLIPLQEQTAGVKAIRLELAGACIASGRGEEAMDSLKRILDLEPHEGEELERVEALFRAEGAWQEVIRTLELRAALESEEVALDLWKETARIHGEELGRPEAGAASLERILERRPADREAFERLRSIYRGSADWRRYVVATERFGANCDEETRLAFLLEIAEIHERRLGQKELAFAKLSAALALAPGDASIREGLERLAAAAGMREELGMIYESAAESRADKPEAAALWMARGKVMASEPGAEEEARESFRQVLSIEPESLEALDALLELSGRVGDQQGRVELLERKLEVCAPEERRGLLLELARSHDEELGDPGEAIYTLRRAFELDPGDGEILERLAKLCTREGRHAELASLLGRARDLAAGTEARLSLQLRIAKLQEEELQDVSAAIASYEAALAIDEANAQALEALERLFTRADRYAELLRIYDQRLKLSRDQDERSKLFIRAARIWEEKLQNPVNAIACLDGALAIESSNLPALRELSRLLRAQEAWERLAVVLQHHESLLPHEPAHLRERLELLVQQGEVLYQELREAADAERIFLSALELDPACGSALAGLSRIYERSGNWQQALAMMERELRVVDEVSEAVEIHSRIARIQGEILGDQEQARAAYERILELDPGHLPSLRSIRSIFQGREDGRGYARSLEQEANYTEEPKEKTRLLVELGRYLLEVSEEADEAVRVFEEAREHTPDDLGASLALSDLYVERERWEEAEVVLDIVCSRLATKGSGEAGLLLHKVYRLGVVASKLGKEEKALRSFARAYELDPTFLPAAEAYGNQLAKIGEHEQALKVFQAILIHHRDDLTDPEVVEVYYTIGELRFELGDHQAAKKSLKSAVELDPWHQDSHRALIALAGAAGDVELEITHLQKLVELVEGEKKLELLGKIAALASEKLADHYLAIDSVSAALKANPDHLPSLEALQRLYRETRQGPKEIELLRRMLELPQVQGDPKKVVEVHLLLAERCREGAAKEPEQLGEAANHFNAALDLDWRQAQAFQALEAMYVQAQDWRGLEASYLKMLERLGGVEGTAKARAVLFRTLGDLYLEALSNPTAAAEAYKAVSALTPADGAAAEKYASLLSQNRGSEPEAIAAWRRAIPLMSSPLQGARTVMRLHARLKHYDEALSAAQVISHLLKAGGEDEEELFARLRGFAKDSASGSLSDRHWHELIFHDEVRGPIGGILAIVQAQAGAIFARDHNSLHIQGRDVRLDPKRDRIDVAESMLFFVNAYRHVAKACGMEAPELFKVQGVVGLTLADTWPHCLIAGEELFTDQRPKKELFFHIGRMLAWSRPELSMALLRPRDQLELVIESAASLGDSSLKTRFNPKTVEKVRRQLGRSISPASQQALKKLAAAYAERRPDVGAFLEAAELTATRAGALLAGDLRVVTKCLAEAGGGDRSLNQRRIADLTAFCLSEKWSSLRKELGINVVVPG